MDERVIIRKHGMMQKPVWFDYVVWAFDEEGFPIMKGLKKGTPKDVIAKYKQDTKQMKEDLRNDPYTKFI